jgi:HrpA-like RNA helicase
MAQPTLFVPGKLVLQPGDPESLKETKPIDYIMEWVEKRSNSAGTIGDRVLILKSSTGSGKSTVIPPELYYRFFVKLGKRNICCTQPRVLTSIEIPRTIIPFHSDGKHGRTPLKMGDNIGFQNGVIAKRPTRGIIFMTIGVLQQQLNIMTPDEFANKYSVIIIDEAHERSVGTDLTLYMMKNLIHKLVKAGNKRCPFLIVMSATFDPVKFANYFDSEKTNSIKMIYVEGLSSVIHDEFLEYDTTNYLQAAVDKVTSIHEEHLDDVLPSDALLQWIKQKKEKKELVLDDDELKSRKKEQVFRDILVFVAGEGDANKIIKKVQKLNDTREIFQEYPVVPIKLMGIDVETRSENYIAITKELSKQRVTVKGKSVTPVRRVIVASNVAETGITIDTLRHVVDTGYLKSSEYDPIYRAQLLVTRPVTLGMYKQRRGRVGRKAPGFSYALYTKSTLEALQVDQFPNIIREDIALDVLALIIRQCDVEGTFNSISLAKLAKLKDYWEKMNNARVNVYAFDLLDPPSADSLHTSLDRLYTLGALSSNCTPTPKGLIMSKFRFISLESIAMILSGYAWKAPIEDLITIAAFLSLKSDIGADRDTEPSPDLRAFDGIRFTKMDLEASCDFITILLAWNAYQDECVRLLEAAEVGELPTSIEDWCESVGVNHSFFEQITSNREDIINSMATIGLNPYANGTNALRVQSELSIDDWIKSIKQCLFEGYKSNIATWNPKEMCYETRFGSIKIPIPDRPYLMKTADLIKYSAQNPKFILYDIVRFRQNPKNEYPPELKYISVLDGFVPMDLNYDF